MYTEIKRQCCVLKQWKVGFLKYRKSRDALPFFRMLSCMKLPARQNPGEGFCFTALTSQTLNDWTQAHTHARRHIHILSLRKQLPIKYAQEWTYQQDYFKTGVWNFLWRWEDIVYTNYRKVWELSPKYFYHVRITLKLLKYSTKKKKKNRTYQLLLNWWMEKTSLHAHCSGILRHSPVETRKTQSTLKQAKKNVNKYRTNREKNSNTEI